MRRAAHVIAAMLLGCTLQAAEKPNVILIYTDDQGSKEYNQKLSENRARAVYNYLIDQGASRYNSRLTAFMLITTQCCRSFFTILGSLFHSMTASTALQNH